MSEAGQNTAPKVHRLAEAVREIKTAAADREDVVVDMRESTRARLEILAQELAPVFAEVPEDDPAFDFAISSGQQPRLWIDSVAHVVMGPDRRTYRFLRDTRLGRVVLGESTEIAPIADLVTRYIAERMVERQRYLEGEIFSLPRATEEEPVEDVVARKGRARGPFLASFFLVILGGIVGTASIILLLWDRFPELHRYFQ
ncbi:MULTISPECIES: hypothetical protein [Chelativorans]|nr:MULTISPECIES: hypothetical protein [Chelativorans]